MISLGLSACSGGGSSQSTDNTVAATVNGKNIMLAEVEQSVSRQAEGQQAQLSQLEMAQARLQVLGSLIQREVLFGRAEREKLQPTEDEITSLINQQKQQSGMTDDDFQKSLTQQKLTMETLRTEARKDIAIRKLQDKYSSKIAVNDKEVEVFTTATGSDLSVHAARRSLSSLPIPLTTVARESRKTMRRTRLRRS